MAIFWQLQSAAIILSASVFFAEISADCQSRVKSTREKADNSQIVILATFLRYKSRFSNSVQKWAEFVVNEVLKQNSTTEISAEGTVYLPLYTGHGRVSKRIWCLNERMLRRSENNSYFLFLKKSQPTEGGTPIPDEIEASNTFDSLYVPIVDSGRTRQSLQRILNTEIQSVTVVPEMTSQAASDADQATVKFHAETTFELKIDTSLPPESPIIIQTAKASLSEQLRIRCQVDGGIHAGNPDLGWVFKGELLQESETLKIDTDESGRETNLRISEFETAHQGEYECSVRSAENQYRKTKLDLTLRTKPHDPTLTGEQLCGELWGTYCQNGGICYEHIESKSKSCKCPPNASGRHCEYLNEYKEIPVETVDTLEIDKICQDVACSNAHAEYQRGMILMGSIFGAVLLLILICMVYFYQRGKFRRSTRMLSDPEAHHASAIRCHPRLANGGLFRHDPDATKLLLAEKHSSIQCQKCGNKMSVGFPDHDFATVDSVSSAELGSQIPHERQPSGGFLPNGRPASLPSSVGTSPNIGNGGQRKDFFPFDPHCPQCVAEWRHVSFSYPGPPAQGLQYASVPRYPIVPTPDYPAYLKRQVHRQGSFEHPKKERHFGVSDDQSLLSSPIPEDQILLMDNSAEASSQRAVSREASNASSHEHQSFRPRVSSGGQNRNKGRTVRFEDQGVVPIPQESEDNTVAWVSRTEHEQQLTPEENGPDEPVNVKETSLNGEDEIVPVPVGEVDVTVAKI